MTAAAGADLSVRQLVKRVVRLPLAYRVVLAWRLSRDPRVPLRARLPLAACLVYLVSPIDLIPDFIPVLGQLDDLLVGGLAVWWFVRVCPPAVALDTIVQLEQQTPGAVARRLPWLIAAVLLLLGAAVLWLAWRRWG